MAALGSRTTAEQALRAESLTGKTAIVTGANSGIGFETARVLALAGARVILAVRDVAASETALSQIAASAKVKPTLSALDLTRPASIADFIARHANEPLELLINNAGVMATPLGVTGFGVETQLGTNHCGHFQLTQGLLPALGAARAARVVTVSSGLHTRGRGARLLETLERDPRYEQRKYNPFDAYGDSKLANILFTKALARRIPQHVLALSLHPGVIPTRLTRSMGFQGVIFRALGTLFMKNVAQGAATTVFAATAPELEGRSGAYLSDCAISNPSADANDGELAEKVFAATERVVQRAQAAPRR